MKERMQLAFIVGALGVYFLVHAYMAGYALYFASEALRPPDAGDLPYLRELRDNYPTIVILFAVVGGLSILSLTASVAFYRNSRWGWYLWFVASLGLVVSVGFAIIAKGVDWTHYLFELSAVGASWWYFPRLKGSGHGR